MTTVRIYTQNEIISLLEEAIAKLQEKDACFLDPEFDINERSVTHRLAMYSENCFVDYQVDCEYNRVLDSNTEEHITKSVIREVDEHVTWSDKEARTVYPDIIVHQRGTTNNLLAIEVKMGWKQLKGDFDRIKAYAYKTQLGYQFSACVTLGPGTKRNITFIDE